MNIEIIWKDLEILEADKIEVNVITLENNRDYEIIDTIKIGDNKYLILSNEKDDNDICVRKVIVEGEREYITKLENKEELEEVMTNFYNKYMKKEENNEE